MPGALLAENSCSTNTELSQREADASSSLTTSCVLGWASCSQRKRLMGHLPRTVGDHCLCRPLPGSVHFPTDPRRVIVNLGEWRERYMHPETPLLQPRDSLPHGPCHGLAGGLGASWTGLALRKALKLNGLYCLSFLVFKNGELFPILLLHSAVRIKCELINEELKIKCENE